MTNQTEQPQRGFTLAPWQPPPLPVSFKSARDAIADIRARGDAPTMHEIRSIYRSAHTCGIIMFRCWAARSH